MPLAAGQTLSFYEILGPIGAGGMGEVYRARDTRLEREVALKVLPDELADDEERLRRFEREARTLASLNHSNVAQVYDIAQVDDTCLMAMELVPGEDLAARLARGPLSVADAIHVCRQIAEALEAAHEAGVVHRDLKPENVRITPDDTVKVLDFGLAKPTGPIRGGGSGSSRRAQPDSFLVTEEGMVLGTPTYMSPEQARAKPVDRRTDVWSFGCVLFECLAGKRAFGGDAVADVLAAIVEREPDWSALPADVPASVMALLLRCLDKEARTRLRDVGEARVVLERAGEEPVAERATGSRGKPLLIGAAIGLVAGSALGAFLLRPTTDGVGPPVAPASFRQISDLPGAERQPSLSPDGKSVVYVSASDGGDLDVFLQRVEGRNPINLTPDSPEDDYAPSFSPDGDSIAFRSERAGGGIFVMGATGESVRRVTDFGYDPAWAPDGSRLAVTTEPVVDPLAREYVSELWVVALDGGERQRLTAGDAVGPRWSPDGRRIAYWGWRDPDWQRDVFTIATDGSETEGVLVTDDPPVDWSPAWTSDGRALYFGSNRGGTMNLWRIAIDAESGRPQGSPVPVTTPSSWSGGFALSADGRRLVYATRDEQTELWTAAFDPGAGALAGAPERIFGGRALIAMDWSPDAERLVLIQQGDPWESMAIIRSDGTGYARITDASIQHRGPRWCPIEGSERILFYSNAFLMTILSDGSGSAMIGDGQRSATALWSRDGRRVLSLAQDEQWRPEGVHLYEVDQDGSSRRIETEGPPIDARGLGVFEGWSPDGKRILCRGQFDSPGLYLLDLETGEKRKLLSEGGETSKWLPDGKRILFKLKNRILVVDTETLEQTLVHEIERDAGQGWGDAMSLSPDGRKLAFLEQRGEGDVWLMDLEGEVTR